MSFDVARTASTLTADPRGLDAIKRDVRAGDDSPETIRAVAKQFESLFAQMLIKSMRATSFGDGLMDSEQSDFYRDIFDQQMATELSSGRGLGLADMLVRQLSQAGGASPTTSGTGVATTGSDAAATIERQPTGAGAVATQPMSSAGAATTANTDWRQCTREDFVRQLWPHAEAAGRAMGVDPATIVSHAALETGWGRSMPRLGNGQASFNLFGIKAAGGWRGGSAPASTLEYQGNTPARSVENFRAYDSLGSGVADYARLLTGSPRYAAALNTGSDIGAFAGALQRAGYATDPQYASKLRAVATQVRSMLGSGPDLKLADARPLTTATRSAT